METCEVKAFRRDSSSSVNGPPRLFNIWVTPIILPFLFIFAVVFGILNKTKVLGESKGVQATIALALGLLSLQFDYVSSFFSIFLPYAGVGIAILLIGIILMGLMYDEDADNNWVKVVFFGLGVLIFLIVVVTSISDSDIF